jgi:hypothetical protein
MIHDDWGTFKSVTLRTITLKNLPESAIHRARGKIFQYGGTLSDPKPPNQTHGRRPVSHVDATNSPSTYAWGMMAKQCATFAVDVCEAAFPSPFPRYNFGAVGIVPIVIWTLLGQAGIDNNRTLPGIFFNRK